MDRRMWQKGDNLVGATTCLIEAFENVVAGVPQPGNSYVGMIMEKPKLGNTGTPQLLMPTSPRKSGTTWVWNPPREGHGRVHTKGSLDWETSNPNAKDSDSRKCHDEIQDAEVTGHDPPKLMWVKRGQAVGTASLQPPMTTVHSVRHLGVGACNIQYVLDFDVKVHTTLLDLFVPPIQTSDSPLSPILFEGERFSPSSRPSSGSISDVGALSSEIPVDTYVPVSHDEDNDTEVRMEVRAH
ncbi:hypothetical protein BJV74DRAFT_794766 [Russula compacta]|nr:hypothetical protein BJV74DRAFT_794766 [Russula compacta]